MGVLSGEIADEQTFEYATEYLKGRDDPIMFPIRSRTVPKPTCEEWLEQQNSIETRLMRS